jgi:hypothetical protein
LHSEWWGPLTIEMKVLLISIWLVCLTSACFADGGCEYASQKFSVGSTRCECPSITIAHMDSTGEKGRLTSRRLNCDKDSAWVDTQTFCVDVEGSQVRPDFYRLSKMYCPMALNPEETEKVFAEADNANSLAAVKGICRRLGSLAAPCKAIMDALAK